jgi:tetratricopeptide (TPR) repeat protein
MRALLDAALLAALLLPGAPADGEDGKPAAPRSITSADMQRLALRETQLAALLSFLERGEEVPVGQVLVLSEEMPEESAVEAAVVASIERVESIRRGAEERARARRRAAALAREESAAPRVGATEPAADAGAAPAPPAKPPVPTERLVALGGLAAADILLDTGRAQDALALFDAALADPESATPYARFRRARCLEALGRIDEAIAAFQAIASDAAGTALAAEAAFAARHVAWRRAFSAAGEGPR